MLTLPMLALALKRYFQEVKPVFFLFNFMFFKVFFTDVPFVGMILGNYVGQRSFEILLPGGASCTDTGLPDFSANGVPMTHSHGLVEHEVGAKTNCFGSIFQKLLKNRESSIN